MIRLDISSYLQRLAACIGKNCLTFLALGTTFNGARILPPFLPPLLPLPDKVKDAKQSVKKLIGQGQGVSNIEITDSNIKSFERVARKYGIDYALRKDTTGTIPKYLVFFKARDADALTAAFKEYSGKSIKREKKPSVLAKLKKFRELRQSNPKREKKKELER